MLYLNQRDYRNVPYYHNVGNGGVPEERRWISTSGCGICSACMIVEHLTTRTLSLEECIKLSERSGANRNVGTRMLHLGPLVAEIYGLDFEMTNDVNKLIAHLQAGGEAAVNVGGDHDDHIGLFSHKGHYIVAVSTDGAEFCILDPSYVVGKYEEEGRKGKVRVNYPFAYCSVADLVADVQNREIPFFLFRRK